MSLEECYIAAGAGYEDVLCRFQSEERVKRFLKMFLNDKSFERLCGEMGEGQYEEAFRAAHTMKGICMNLSFTALYDSCAALTENLRPGSADGDTQRLFERAKQDYARTKNAICAYLG